MKIAAWKNCKPLHPNIHILKRPSYCLQKNYMQAQATSPGIAKNMMSNFRRHCCLFQNPLWVQHLINEREVDGVKMVDMQAEETAIPSRWSIVKKIFAKHRCNLKK